MKNSGAPSNSCQHYIQAFKAVLLHFLYYFKAYFELYDYTEKVLLLRFLYYYISNFEYYSYTKSVANDLSVCYIQSILHQTLVYKMRINMFPPWPKCAFEILQAFKDFM